MEAIAVDDALKRSHHADLALLGRLVGIQFLDDFQDRVKVTLPQMPLLVLLRMASPNMPRGFGSAFSGEAALPPASERPMLL
jgi:hypothetical protein